MMGPDIPKKRLPCRDLTTELEQLGEKFGLLAHYRNEILTSGFSPDRNRSVLSVQLLNSYLNSIGLSFGYEPKSRTEAHELTNKLATIPFTRDLNDRMREALDFLPKDVPIMVRGSTHGDGLGNGVYESTPCLNSYEQVERVIRSILRSYFSRSAISFRRDGGFLPGMAIGLESIIGSWECPVTHNEVLRGGRARRFGPLISGIISADEVLGPYAIVASGLADRLVLNPALGLVVTKANARVFSERFREDVQNFGRNTRLFCPTLSRIMDGEASPDIGVSDLSPLLAMYSKLSDLLHFSPYVEFAGVKTQNGIDYTVLQLAKSKPQADLSDRDTSLLVKDEDCLLHVTEQVSGAGIVPTRNIFVLKSAYGLEALREYNRTHRGYILVVSDEMVTSAAEDDERLRYGDHNNAGVLFVTPFGSDEPRLSRPLVSHQAGACRLTGKLLALVLPSEREGFLARIREKSDPVKCLTGIDGDDAESLVLRKEVLVVSSEKRRSLIVRGG